MFPLPQGLRNRDLSFSMKLLLIWLVMLLKTDVSLGQAIQETISSESDTAIIAAQYQSVRPYVLILPGILGEQMWDRRIRQGIIQSGIGCDVEIYDWTKGPLMMVSNIGGDSREVTRLIKSIANFKKTYPNRPLYLIGHSGGCRMTVRVLEQLDHQPLVDRAILLSPGMESSYEMNLALDGTRRGIVTYYSPLDFPISAPLTFARGLTKMSLHAPAATFGFVSPSTQPNKSGHVGQAPLIQLEYRADMLSTGNVGGHFGWTVPRFVAQYIVPWFRL